MGQAGEREEAAGWGLMLLSLPSFKTAAVSSKLEERQRERREREKREGRKQEREREREVETERHQEKERERERKRRGQRDREKEKACVQGCPGLESLGVLQFCSVVKSPRGLKKLMAGPCQAIMTASRWL